MKNKQTFGKAFQHIELQVSTILESIHHEEIKLRKILQRKSGSEKLLLVEFYTKSDPITTRSRLFGVQRIGSAICDVWLEGPSQFLAESPTNDAA